MQENKEPNYLDAAVYGLNELNKRKDFFDTIAETMKNYYDALISVGFTEGQSIKIVAGFAAKSDK
ncbi:MAG: hypothetical protein J7L77_00600 [Clostridiales bacterium]|nr:hypothetical protein [Clostridiales bacterium]